MEKHWLKSYPPGVRPEINVNEYPSLKELIERGIAIHAVRDAYVQMGSRVTSGQTLCIIEAMKIMNEIEAEVAGVIREVCVEDATPVEYGQVLYRVDPNG